jgi:SAM-dependent methyltransferase
MAEEREYVLGTHDDELLRLGFQHRVWSAATFALWERAGLGAGQAVLDLGCGPGFAALDLARWVGPTGRVLAVDVSRRFLSHLQAQHQAQALVNIDVFEGDVQELAALSLPAAGLDAAYARWVFCFLPRPEAVIAGVAQALRPGGVFAIQDYFNYVAGGLAPQSEIVTRAFRATDASWRSRGGDPDIAGRLPALLAAAGFTVREIRPCLRAARPGSTLWEWPTTFFRNYLPVLVAQGFLSPAEQAEFEQEWRIRSEDPHTFFCTPPVYEIIAERL